MAESYRDLVSGLFEIHFNVTANKTTEVMKVLAIFFRNHAVTIADLGNLRNELRLCPKFIRDMDIS